MKRRGKGVRGRQKNAGGEADAGVGVKARGEQGWGGEEGGKVHRKSGDKQPFPRILDEVRAGWGSWKGVRKGGLENETVA